MSTERSSEMSTEIEWARHGTQFIAQTRSDKSKALPGGVYRYGTTPQGQWLLDRTGDAFEFPFKVYDAGEHIIKRIMTYWQVNAGNLGIMMVGTRGTGKSMTAQLLANRLIREQKIPVVVVRSPIPLQVIFDTLQQHMMVIFDEFEKTHDKENQQALLSTVDGMSRSAFNRLIVFTTNAATIDENFRDRPSRIHYQFEFNRIADETIEGLILDGLPRELHYFKEAIMDFLHTRHICTIDIVKAVISEVRTFREPPSQFETMLNISKGEPPAYNISILEEDGSSTVFLTYFRPETYGVQITGLLSGNTRAIQNFMDRGQPVEIFHKAYDGSYGLNLLEKAKEEYCWLAQLSVPFSKTPFRDFKMLETEQKFYIDRKPEGWRIPFSLESIKDKAEMEKLEELFDGCLSHRTVYGTKKRAVLKIRIEPNREPVRPSRWSAEYLGGGFGLPGD